ncbi:MFS transporter [Cohnella endophytica]|uniref:MFS transporter n=1 Tax=Cohnella endophytica TaxID=2419778 RepID=A0A494XEL4_9BACL|nr:MFS transporter [Cohnella endophytica]RKP48958.1 MFS transporter [Cohnella endophytica]
MNRSLTNRQIWHWRIAIYFIFALPGFTIASWVSRTPAIRDALGATTSQMGWIILGMSIGAIVGLTSASHLIAHKGGRFVMMTGLSINAVGLLAVGICGTLLTNSMMLFVGLAVFGFGHGICDVAMNVEGTAVEKVAQKSLLTGFHAAFSVGTLLGSLAGTGAVRIGISVPIHLAIAVAVLLFTTLYVYRLVPAGTAKEAGDSKVKSMNVKERMAIWKERRTILVGIIVLGMAFAEGSANDWLPLLMVDGYKVTPAMGSFSFGVFVAAMTLCRAVGGKLLDRFGRVVILRASAISAIIGLLLVIFGHNHVVAIVGIVFWGVGAACGFPVGLSAAGDDPRGVAARVGAVSTVGYIAFLVGPPVLGLIGQSVGLLRALIVVLIAVVVAGLLSQAAKPLGAQTRKANDQKTKFESIS